VGAEDSILGKEVFALEEQALVNHATHVRQQSCPTVVLHHESTWWRLSGATSQTYFLTERASFVCS
jgi:hypothetical protein